MVLATPAEAAREYAINVGRENPDRAWILTHYDTWERNPFYSGPPQRHPEDDEWEPSPGSVWAATLPGETVFYLHYMDADGEIHVDEGGSYPTSEACMAQYWENQRKRDDAFDMPW